ncbi:MAG TPA: response regulator transcription factor [Paucimonas sp.]|nr:response regulator transcription factor [Paucimonas sp.]
MQRIALVEDHSRLAKLIAQGLNASGIAVDVFASAAVCAAALRDRDYAAIVLDRGLPDGDGLEWLRRQRLRGCSIPCLMLTARDALHDRVDGLEAGADDYLTKPFSMAELVARVRALLRRPAAMVPLAPSFDCITVDAAQGLLLCGEASLPLSGSELQVLLCLVRAGGSYSRRGKLESAAWGADEAVTPNALDVVIHRLRQKLVQVGATVQIKVRRGVGYALAVAEG